MIIRHDRSEKESVIKENTWPGVTTFFRGHGAATLIAANWLLTAAHVAQGIPPPVEHPLSVELSGIRYRIARVVVHPAYRPEWVQEEEGNSDTVDLAAVELETPVRDVTPYALYDRFDEQGQEVLLLGWGESGNGLRGALSIDRALRQATNIIDQADDYRLKFRFDLPPGGTRLEGVCGRGDSGGPAFIRQNDRLLLAGVSSWQEDNDRPLGMYGCVEHYARMSTHLEWICRTYEL